MIPASVMNKFCIGEHRKNPSPDHKTSLSVLWVVWYMDFLPAGPKYIYITNWTKFLQKAFACLYGVFYTFSCMVGSNVCSINKCIIALKRHYLSFSGDLEDKGNLIFIFSLRHNFFAYVLKLLPNIYISTKTKCTQTYPIHSLRHQLLSKNNELSFTPLHKWFIVCLI